MKRASLTLPFVTLFLAVLASAIAANGGPPSRAPGPEVVHLSEEIDQVLRKTHTPGAAVALVRRDGATWVTGFGVADIASGRRVSAATLFRVGSVTKIFAALAVLKLREAGRLGLEDTLRSRAPGLEFSNPWERTDPVRIVHVLEHTAGWDDWPLSEYGRRLPSDGTLREGLAFHPATRTSRWRPGTKFSYSNADAPAAADVVEKVTGKRFEDYVQETWFAPLGMKAATFLGTPDVLQQLATSYQPDGKTPFPYWYQLERPAGALNASVEELANLVRFFLDRGEFEGRRLLSATDIARMETPETTDGARAGLPSGYGLDNYATLLDGQIYHGHDGTLLGYITELKYLPDAGLGYVFAINSRNGEAAAAIGRILRREIEKSAPLLPPPPVIPVPASVPEKFDGWYEDDGPRFEFMHWWWRLSSLSRLRVGPTSLNWKPLLRPAETLLPTSDHLFRRERDPVPTLALLDDGHNAVQVQFSGRFEGGGAAGQSFRKVPYFIVLAELATATGALVLAGTSWLVALIWVIRILARQRPGRASAREFVAPILASTILFAIATRIAMSAHGDLNQASALTAPSTPTFLGGAILAFVLSIAGLANPLRHRPPIWRRALAYLAFATSITLALVSGYLVYWGLSGLRTW